MPPDRRSRIDALVTAASDGALSSARLCELTRDVVDVSGAGVMLMSGDVPRGSLCGTNEVSALVEELQFTLGEGPCVDAYNHGYVVLEPDLADPATPRWPAFSVPALESGVRAIFAFPLRMGAARLGALDLYRDAPGSLRDDQHADALAMAEVVTRWVLGMQADAQPGAIADEVQRGADFHFVVHNAAGAVSVQLGISVTEALVRLRAYAFANDRALRDVAEDVVARRLRF